MSTHIEAGSIGRRFDLSTPAFVFGGVLAATLALCTIEASSNSSNLVEDVRVEAEQGVISPSDFDLVASECTSQKQEKTHRKTCQTTHRQATTIQ